MPMIQLLVFVISICIFAILLIVDNKIKGNFSIILKVLSLVFVGTLLFAFVFLYGETFFRAYQVNIKSFTNVKGFLSSKVFGIIVLLLICLFAFLKTFYITFRFITKKSFNRVEKAVVLASIIFDVIVIPNIFSFEGTSVLFVCLATLSLFEIGLTLTGLVFSIAKTKKNICFEVAYGK